MIKYNENITNQPENSSVSFTVDLEYLQKGDSTNFSEADTNETDTGFRISDLQVNADETSLEPLITANKAVKYYYSLDNDKWCQ